MKKKKRKKIGLDALYSIAQEYCATGVEFKLNLNKSILFSLPHVDDSRNP